MRNDRILGIWHLAVCVTNKSEHTHTDHTILDSEAVLKGQSVVPLHLQSLQDWYIPRQCGVFSRASISSMG